MSQPAHCCRQTLKSMGISSSKSTMTGHHSGARSLHVASCLFRAPQPLHLFTGKLSLLESFEHKSNTSLCYCLCRPEGSVQATHHVLNECLIDRGSSPSMVRTELFVDGHHITTVQASAWLHHDLHMDLYRCMHAPLCMRALLIPAEPCLTPGSRPWLIGFHLRLIYGVWD